ncbi:M28 family metallopeptidase [Sphingomonas sp. SUN039]|uniref:M28 family metallopeptidase n=1 Tax=Sphingomonas sp. SUN039 TaxID=2937787 RepID=UPI0021647715|nr:M28 family metallopeptidase [Sphingomonas sp. SUN039]UVO54846.1 M28 family metallopeptidase [Sphingomonas sp. SUN039]
MKALLVPLPALALIAAAPAPDPAKLRATVDTLAAFGTRHTASSTTDPKRGIGAARNWAAGEFAKLSAACGGCIAVDRPSARFEGPRAPNGVIVEDVLAIQRGTGDPNHIVIVAGHIDSRNSDPMDATGDAPGANDDASGVALVMEAARILSKERHSATIVYAALSGEEQGLWGGKLLADTAKARGWQVAAMLNNDIVGNTRGQDGRIVADRVRVFSEGARASEDLAAAKLRRASGGEDDSSSRALAKRVGDVAAGAKGGLAAFLIRRPDRFGRGGDHTALLEAGYPAVRFSVGVENYDAQHQNLRTEGGRVYGDTADRMDFPYLAKVTALNVAVLRQLAAAPGAPASVVLEGAVSTDTTVKWTAVAGAAGYRLRWRRADRPNWEFSRDVPATAASEVLKGLIVDDHFVGVSALSKDGAESLVTFGGLAAAR